MVSLTKLFHLQLSRDGLKLYCRWHEFILVHLRVTWSFRGASTSKAVSLGAPLDVILKEADWKNAGTFAKFLSKRNIFCRPVCSDCTHRLMLCLCYTNKMLFGEAFIVWCYLLRSEVCFELCNLNPAGGSIIRKRI